MSIDELARTVEGAHHFLSQAARSPLRDAREIEAAMDSLVADELVLRLIGQAVIPSQGPWPPAGDPALPRATLAAVPIKPVSERHYAECADPCLAAEEIETDDLCAAMDAYDAALAAALCSSQADEREPGAA